MPKFRITTLLIALVAMLAFSSSALAKHGGDGGGGGGGKGGGGGGGDAEIACARIDSFTLTTGHDESGAPTLTKSYSISTTCFDEGGASAAEDSINNTTGFVGRSLWYLYPGLNTSTTTTKARAGDSITMTLTVYAPNGKIADQRTQTVTIPVALTPAA
jgi:hypothetical protein